MRLLPDIVINDGHKISMQPPYTVDGNLIVSMIEVGPCNYSNSLYLECNDSLIKFELENREQLCVTITALAEKFEEKARILPQLDGDGLFAYEINGVWCLPYNTFTGFIDDIREQCKWCGTTHWYLAMLRTRLNIQHRGSSSYTTTASDMAVQNTYNIMFGDVIGADLDYSSKPRQYIHTFNYKPEYIKHYTEIDKTALSPPLLLGVELEVAGNDHESDREQVVKKCIQIMNQSDSDDESIIYSTSDSSVQIELDVMPCTLGFHKTLPYKELFHYLDTEGYKGHDAENAGLHIHADRSYLGNTPLKQKLVISKILYLLEKFNGQVCVIARKNNQYSQFLGQGNDDALHLLKCYSGVKKAALNLCHDNTIEFRMFRSTLKYETFILTLEFVKDIIDYAKSCSIEDIEQMKWEDLYASFSPKLKAYYDNRLEKQNTNAKIKKLRHEISRCKSELKYCQDYHRRNEINLQIEKLNKEKKKLRRST